MLSPSTSKSRRGTGSERVGKNDSVVKGEVVVNPIADEERDAEFPGVERKKAGEKKSDEGGREWGLATVGFNPRQFKFKHDSDKQVLRPP